MTAADVHAVRIIPVQGVSYLQRNLFRSEGFQAARPQDPE